MRIRKCHQSHCQHGGDLQTDEISQSFLENYPFNAWSGCVGWARFPFLFQFGTHTNARYLIQPELSSLCGKNISDAATYDFH